jgi:hypothetical protein
MESRPGGRQLPWNHRPLRLLLRHLRPQPSEVVWGA